MTIEILYGAVSLYGDEFHPRYLQKCLPDARFIFTEWGDEPYFATERPDMIYCGGMSEKSQLRSAEHLRPFADRLARLRDDGVVMLFTGNSIELLGEYIEDGGEKFPMLGLYPFYARRDLKNRINSLFHGKFGDIDILGFNSRFCDLFGEFDKPFATVVRGRGVNADAATEGVHDRNLFATDLIGPLLVVSPDFTKYLLSLLGADAKIPFEKESYEAYNERMSEFSDQGRKFEL